MTPPAEEDESSTGDKTLQLLIGGGAGEPEELFVIGPLRPDGRVRVRAWSSRDWGAEPNVSDREARELLAYLERAARSGRSLNHELAGVRSWLIA